MSPAAQPTGQDPVGPENYCHDKEIIGIHLSNQGIAARKGRQMHLFLLKPILGQPSWPFDLPRKGLSKTIIGVEDEPGHTIADENELG